MKHRVARLSAILVVIACSDAGDRIERADRLTVSPPVTISSADTIHDIHDLALDGSGNVWVLSTFDPHLFILSEDGEILDRLGPSGSGPGELRNPQGFVTEKFLDGSIAVWDPGKRSVQWFGEDGETIGDLRIRVDAGLVSSRAEDRSYIEPARLEAFGDGFVQDVYPGQVSGAEDLWTGALVRIEGNGEVADTLVRFSDLPAASLRDRSATDPRHLLAPVPLWASCGARIAVLSAPGEEVLWIDSAGTIVERRAVDLPPVPVTEADRSRFLRQQIALEAREEGLDPDSPEIDRMVEQILESGRVAFPDRAPPVRLRCVGDAELWVQLFSTEQDPRGYGRTWIRIVAGEQESVRLPVGFTPIVFEEDQLIGIQKDELGVEHVAIATVQPRS